MSRGIKTLWIVIGSIFALGIVLAAVGFALGASGSAWFDRQGLHFGYGEERTMQLANNASESFEDIDIRLIEADVEILVADNYGYDFTYTGTNDPRIEVRHGTLTVVEQEDNWRINIFGFWNWRGWSLFDTHAILKVYVPRNAALNSVSFSTASGRTVLNGNQISIKKLDCNSASGDIRLTDLTLEQLSLDVASGDVDMNNVAAASANINMLSGRLNYRGAELDSLVLNMTSGDVDLEGEVTKLLQLRMISGDASILLAGNQDDYSFQFRKLSGNIKVNGQRVDGNTSWPSSTNTSGNGQGGHIEVDTTSGNVNIDFR